MCQHRQFFAQTLLGRRRNPPNESIPRHCHADGYVELILRGGYLEAGDEGRRRVEPGDVLMHQPFESHFDQIGHRGVEVLMLPLTDQCGTAKSGRIDDPDEVVRLAEECSHRAADLLNEKLRDVSLNMTDWPDLLAAQLRRDPNTCLRDWAASACLAPETVSRGFKLAFRTSPSAYRATMRARQAWSAVRKTTTPLAELAVELGFADQAHMTRAVAALTGRPPGAWRRSSQLKTDFFMSPSTSRTSYAQ